VSVGATGGGTSYDIVMLGSGDREHPLKNTATGSSYNVANRFYVLKDTQTGMDGTGITAIVESALFNATSTVYDGSLSGFYTTFATGEKAVNASVTVRGTTFFGTNQPTPPSATSCTSNLGVARGYAIDPFKGTFDFTTFDGGGLPPTPTTGIVTIVTSDGRSVQRSFCVGCGGSSGGDSRSALGAGDLGKQVPRSPRRTYWYKQ
jgi:type IV pilus assembly protein PilY1